MSILQILDDPSRLKSSYAEWTDDRLQARIDVFKTGWVDVDAVRELFGVVMDEPLWSAVLAWDGWTNGAHRGNRGHSRVENNRWFVDLALLQHFFAENHLQSLRNAAAAEGFADPEQFRQVIEHLEKRRILTRLTTALGPQIVTTTSLGHLWGSRRGAHLQRFVETQFGVTLKPLACSTCALFRDARFSGHGFDSFTGFEPVCGVHRNSISNLKLYHKNADHPEWSPLFYVKHEAFLSKQLGKQPLFEATFIRERLGNYVDS